jgi:GTP1/Obg family GTP-binding protein
MPYTSTSVMQAYVDNVVKQNPYLQQEGYLNPYLNAKQQVTDAQSRLEQLQKQNQFRTETATVGGVVSGNNLDSAIADAQRQLQSAQSNTDYSKRRAAYFGDQQALINRNQEAMMQFEQMRPTISNLPIIETVIR